MFSFKGQAGEFKEVFIFLAKFELKYTNNDIDNNGEYMEVEKY